MIINIIYVCYFENMTTIKYTKITQSRSVSNNNLLNTISNNRTTSRNNYSMRCSNHIHKTEGNIDEQLVVTTV